MNPIDDFIALSRCVFSVTSKSNSKHEFTVLEGPLHGSKATRSHLKNF